MRFDLNRNMSKKNAIKEFWDWVLICIVSPVVLPLFFALCVSLFYVRIEMSMYELFQLLFKNGVYTFLGLTILISLFQDYREAPEAFTLLLYLTILFSFFIIGFIFLSSLGFVPKDKAISFEENLFAFSITTAAILSLSLLFKYRILIIKHNKNLNL